MKKFKEIDIAINIVLFAATIFMLLFGSIEIAFVLGYFGVGAWQIISMLVHIASKDNLHLSSRRDLYHLLVLCIAVLAAMSFALEPLMVILVIPMFFAGPIMAISYFRMCYKETYYYNVRPLAVIK